ncbi:RNase H domain-containing protein [Trichonephila clavipes]|nr:RNase H domain-containing protein [Trichonephila clavipes]
MITYEAVFSISGFPPIDIFIIRNNELKIATKNCTNKSLDGSFLNGHGNFKAYLKHFNLSPTDQCSCSSDTIQNAKHMILACAKLSSERRTGMNCLQKNNIVWPPPFSAFVDGKSSFTSFSAYIHTLLDNC